MQMINPFEMGYYSSDRENCYGSYWLNLKDIFKKVGRNVKIAKNCTIIGPENIEIGDNVRIDGYTTIIANEGFVKLGSYIHIAAYVWISASCGIVMEDFTAVSHGSRVYSRNDDYTGKALTNPMIPNEYHIFTGGQITMRKHSLIGAGCVVLPGVELGEGASVGALSLVNKSLDPWGVYVGVPARKLKDRLKDMLKLEKKFLESKE